MTIECPACGHEIDAPTRALNRNGLPLRIADLLEVDGPLTTSGVATALEADVQSVRRALYRMRRRGIVAGAALAGRNGTHDPRISWRLADD